MPLRMYRAATDEESAIILARGFVDDETPYGLAGDDEIWGVWLAREAADMSDGDNLLEVVLDMTEDEAYQYGVPDEEDDDDTPSDWVIPADVINSVGKVRVVPDDERVGWGCSRASWKARTICWALRRTDPPPSLLPPTPRPLGLDVFVDSPVNAATRRPSRVFSAKGDGGRKLVAAGGSRSKPGTRHPTGSQEP